VCAIGDIDVLVTDSNADENDIEALRAQGVVVIVA